MDRFSFFFAFYGLILGLAVAELLGGFARMVRAGAVRRIESQTALIAIFTFIVICATWIDAFALLDYATLDLEGLAAPVLAATCYFLVATVIFPSDEDDFADLGGYFARRKLFIVGLLLTAEVLVTITLLPNFADRIARTPALLWLWLIPYNIAIKGTFVALLLARRPSLIIALELLLLALFLIPYWNSGAISKALVNAFG